MLASIANTLARRRVRRNTRHLRGRGIEIGALDLPIPGIRPIHVDRAASFAGMATGADVLADALALPFATGALDYVAGSHVLEHLPNPVRALAEWHRTVHPGGWIYLVVPDRRYTFDRPRALTPVEHMLADFDNQADYRDPTHFEDYARNRELAGSRIAAGRDPEEWPALRERMLEQLRKAAAGGEVPELHYHVFEPSNLVGLIERMKAHPGLGVDWEIELVEERSPPGRGDGVLLLLRVGKR